jgi:2'-5' RNA ligase
MALAVCLLLDERSDRLLRALWRRLEAADVDTLLTHTHGRHRPHLTLASLLEADVDQVLGALAAVPARPALSLRFDALGTFRRSRCWLVPAASRLLLDRQEEVVAACRSVEAVLHRNYEPEGWTPHLTLAPRLHLAQLPVVAGLAFEILPVEAVLDRLAVIDTATGEVYRV